MDASNVYRYGGSRKRYVDGDLLPKARLEDFPSYESIFELQLALSSRREGSCEAVAIELVSRLPGRI